MGQGTGLPLGYYQLNNLITSRIPFLILSVQNDFSKVYSGMELHHIRNFSVELDPSQDLNAQSVAAIVERHIPKEYPILAICETGKTSKEIADYLDEQGYSNTFYLLDGFKGYQEDLAKSKSEQGS